MEIKLSDFKKGMKGKIIDVLENPVSTKLAEFGILPGVAFSILNRAPFKGPIFIQIDNNRIALRFKEAAFIVVE
ncbi:FeoA family protein [Crocinitomix catalasitica]|uniref:FeoA family protein n=1 Tax=Crocinitomix catalasitica TaxID=184607 RepID=UPI0004862A5A|nr:FeoA family protein [Crocinitomix catalasitica]